MGAASRLGRYRQPMACSCGKRKIKGLPDASGRDTRVVFYAVGPAPEDRERYASVSLARAAVRRHGANWQLVPTREKIEPS